MKLALIISASTLAWSCSCSTWQVGQPVNTTSGLIQGHAAHPKSSVSEYLGIPYALPPIDSLRFQPPVRYNGTSPVPGSNFGCSCIPSNITSDDSHVAEGLIRKYSMTAYGEKFLTDIVQPNLTHSEDCLTLNVWTSPQTGDKRKAVMVWIHGGSFVTGSSALPSYNGQFLAHQEDVVVVTINYRLSIFGFPGDPLSHANPGLLDQRLAIEWVRDNIALFGGDPSRITIFGQSAGGVSVDDYSYAWPSDPIVHGLIAQSGTTTGIGNRTQEQANEFWFAAAKAAGCGNSGLSAKHVHDCMLRVPVEAILGGLSATVNSPVTMPYGPTIDNAIVFANYTGRKAAALPLLIGSTDFEYGLFELFTDQNVTLDEWKQQGQSMFGCPAARRAAASVRDGNPTWRYRYMAAFANTELSTNPPSGAYHEAEVPLVFDTVDQSYGKSKPREKALGSYLRGAWATFAKDPAKGLRKYGWPEYQPDKKTLIRLGYRNHIGPNAATVAAYDEGC